MPTGLDRFSANPAVRLAAVFGWFTITAIAFDSRYEKFTPMLSAGIASVVILVAGLGVVWALLPLVNKRRRRRT